MKIEASRRRSPPPLCPHVRQLTVHDLGGLMSTGNKSLFSTTALAVAFAATTFAGSALAADMVPAKAPPKAAAEPPVFFVNQNSISYSYAFTANNPGAGKTPKDILNFTHFDVWAYGTNFFTVDWLKATNGSNPPNGAPAAPCDSNPARTGCAGFTEIYGLFRSTFGWNQIFNTKAFAVGPMTNIEFVVGADLNTDNTTLGSAKRSIQGGLQLDFATPYKGFLNVGAFAYHEWQNDGFAANGAGNNLNPSGKVDFNTTWALEMLYVQPLGFQPLPLTFKSFAVIHGPKGCGEPCNLPGPGLVRTTEYLTQQTLLLDVGKLAWGKADQFSVWTAYRWWKNKFGIAPNQPFGSFSNTVESTWLTGATVTF